MTDSPPNKYYVVQNLKDMQQQLLTPHSIKHVEVIQLLDDK